MKTAIIIPARYGSTRFPGKPLALIAGKSMLARVVALAQKAAENDPSVQVLVATDDKRVLAHAKEIGAPCTMTSPACPTGTDRVFWGMMSLDAAPDLIINLQGDAPLTPPHYLRALIDSFSAIPCDVVTPVAQLTWEELDSFRESKRTTPFSGTTAVFDEKTGRALWFSKTILPALRKESSLRQNSPLSPVFRHIGIYGYSFPMLEKFSSLPKGHYEELEELEQLRVIENGYDLRCVHVQTNGRPSFSGIDSPEDIARAEELLARYGEP